MDCKAECDQLNLAHETRNKIQESRAAARKPRDAAAALIGLKFAMYSL